MRGSAKIWLLALLIVPLLAMGLRVWGLNASETWDEVAYYDAAHDYYQNVVNDRWAKSEAWIANREHPAIAKWLYLLPSLDPISKDVYDPTPGRLLAASLGSLTVLITMLLARRLFDARVAVVAGLTLALLPTVIGLNRVLGLDTPFTFFFVLTIWAFIEALTRSRNDSLPLTFYSLPSWVWHFIALVAFGLAMGTRLTGVLLWPILGAIAAIVIASEAPARNDSPARSAASAAGWRSDSGRWRSGLTYSRLLRQLLPRIDKRFWQRIGLALLYLIVPPALVFATWPWLWHATVAHWDITWGHWSPVASWFLGALQEPGSGYYVIYFLATFPALFVLLSILWAARAIARPSRSDLILLVWVLGVLAFSAYGLRQGGFRYLIQLAPALAIGVSAYLVELAAGMKDRRAIWLLPAIFIAYLIPHAVLHQPYQLDYYNELVGGTKQVAVGKWLQVGWWGEGVDEATDWLNAHAPLDATVSYTAIPDRTRFRLRPDFDHTAVNPDYILTNPAYTWSRTEYPRLQQYQRVYAVKAHDAVIAEVWERIE